MYRANRTCNLVVALGLLVLCAGVSYADKLPGDGEESAKVLEKEKEQPNKNRMAKEIGSLNDIREKQKNLYKEKLLNVESKDIDVFWNPHLYDILVEKQERIPIAKQRARAGLTCGKDTSIYEKLIEDENWKICCVRKAEKDWTLEQIACEHPRGDGWAGEVLVWMWTTAFGWGNQRTETAHMTKDEVKKAIQKVDKMMEDEDAQKWVVQTNEVLMESIEKIKFKGDNGGGQSGGNNGGKNDRKKEVEETVKDVIKEVRPEDKELRFTDGLWASMGHTVRPLFPARSNDFLKKLGEQYCLHPDQFKKPGDGDKEEDPYQKAPKGTEGQDAEKVAEKVPPWCDFCPNGVFLERDYKETLKLENVDKTPTDFPKGMKAWQKDHGFCDATHRKDDSHLTVELKDSVEQAFGQGNDEKEVGYTCRKNGKSWNALVPVTGYREAQVGRRAPESMLARLIAASLYQSSKGGDEAKMIDKEEKKSYYKRFEPIQYFQVKAKQWKPQQGKTNELMKQCPREVKGEDEQGKKVNDHAYLSNKTKEGEKGLPFIQEVIKDWNYYFAVWTSDGNTEFRGLNDQSQNNGAAGRVQVICPKGYRLWSKAPQDKCPKEKLW